MLQNEPQTEQAPGQARITPEELSRAVAAIERRKEAEAQRLVGTIAIDEAVSQLHLDATPEDIWQEVQAQRNADVAAHGPTKLAPPPQTQSVAPQPQARVQPAAAAQSGGIRWKRLLAIGASLWLLHILGVGPHFGHTAGPTAPALTATAAQIPDGTQFYCDSAGLVQLSEGKPLPQVRVSTHQASDSSWTLVKMAGHVYLRAYTLPLSSVQAVRGQPLVLYSDDNSGALEGKRTAQTTLRVDKVPLEISGGDDDYAQITVPNFQPDQFTTTSEWR